MLKTFVEYLQQPFDDYNYFLFWAKLNNFRKDLLKEEPVWHDYQEDVYGNWQCKELIISKHTNPKGVPIVYVLSETSGNNIK